MPTVPTVDDVKPLTAGQVVSNRFEILRKLGEGSAGVVYEARDRQRDTVVALKTLRLFDAEFLYLLKREFRSLTNLNHPNLVTLHELVVEDGLAFITMERIEGVHWLEWVRPPDETHPARIRDGLRQLVHALHHLHRNGLVHRDVKPSNVMVKADGTVKLLDFGLAFSARSRPDPSDSFVVGTLDYLSPEQASGQPVTAASDWFALGVMLFEALTGSTPWADLDGRALLRDRTQGEPRMISSLGFEVPEDLDLLSLDLRLPDPDLRPGADEILRRLGAAPIATPLDEVQNFVGRTVERSQLAAAVDRGLMGVGPRLLTLCGRSGTGKSALSQALLESLGHRTDALVLSGQCFEREAVRYSGVDAVVDALRAHLLERDPDQLEALLPPGAGALAYVFPVLEDLVEPDPTRLPTDPLELQRYASDAFRDLLTSLARDARLVVFIDDLHWCGDETGRLLLHLLTAPRDARLVIVGTYRSEMLERASSLEHLLSEAARHGDAWSLELGPLPYEEACRLAAARLGTRSIDDICDTIARESGGNPLFVEELARHAEASTSVRGAARVGLEAMTQARVRELPPHARTLLQLVAIAGGPISQRVAVGAGGHTEGAAERIAELRVHNFVRTYGPAIDDALEVYHSRVRLAVVDMMSDDQLTAHHHSLARALERDDADAEVLAFHFARSGKSERAVFYLRKASQLAARALAFRRAAELARQALDLLPAGALARQELESELGDALSNDGRGAEAAEAYLRAAEVTGGDTLELKRRAAEQYLRSGHAAEGLPLLTDVLKAVGLRLARSPRRAIGSWLLQRATIAITGTDYVPTDEADVSAAALLRVDICWTAAIGLPSVDVLLGQDFQARHLRLALQLGEPRRVARALSLEILYAATSGTRNEQKVDELLSRVRGIANQVGSPHVDGLLELALGVARVYRGEFATALGHLGQASQIFRTRCSGVAWELSFTSTFEALAMLYLGEFTRFIETTAVAASDALARDDLSTMLMVRIGYDYLRHLVDDDPDRARRELDASIAWRPKEAQTPTYRFTMLMARGRIERYAGHRSDAHACFTEHHDAVRKSMMLTKQPFLLYFSFERASGALWAAQEASGSARRELLDLVRRDTSKIRNENTRWGRVFVGLLEASTFAGEGRGDDAQRALNGAHEAAVECSMRLFAAAIQVRLDELQGRPARDYEAFTSQGVQAPARMVDMHAPPILGW